MPDFVDIVNEVRPLSLPRSARSDEEVERLGVVLDHALDQPRGVGGAAAGRDRGVAEGQRQRREGQGARENRSGIT